jgi:hypothetical protein
VRAFVTGQGWTLVAEHSDVASGKDDRRPGFQAALVRCRHLGAVLVAARPGRISIWAYWGCQASTRNRAKVDRRRMLRVTCPAKLALQVSLMLPG